MNQPTPPRGRQLLPTQPEQRAYLKSIREAADRGDLSAMASALFLTKLAEQIEATEELGSQIRRLTITVEAEASRQRLRQTQEDMNAAIGNFRSTVFAALDRAQAAQELETK